MRSTRSLPMPGRAGLLLLTLTLSATACWPAVAAAGKIQTFAGDGTRLGGKSGCANLKEEGPAKSMTVTFPLGLGLAVDRNGTVFSNDSHLQRVNEISKGYYRVVAKGTPLTLNGKTISPFKAGRKPKGLSKAERAMNIEIWEPTAIVVRPNGILVVADGFNHHIVEIDPTASVHSRQLKVIAGNGKAGFSADGTKAIRAGINSPSSLALDRNGDVLFTDSNHVVRRIHDGVISTVAGSGKPGFSGDEGDALKAQLHAPAGLAVGEHGEIFVADMLNDRIRMIFGGKISTVAGSGEAGFNTRDGRALEVNLNGPFGLTYLADGVLVFSETFGHTVRQLSLPLDRQSDGEIKTLLGDGEPGFSADGVDADQTKMDAPGAVAVTSKGELLVVDFKDHAIRIVDLGLPTPFQFRELEQDLDALVADIEGPSKSEKEGSRCSAKRGTANKSGAKKLTANSAETKPVAKPSERVDVRPPETTSEKKKDSKRIKRIDEVNQGAPSGLDEDDADWTVVAGRHKLASASKPTSAIQSTLDLLSKGEDASPSKDLERATNSITKNLLESWDDEWEFAWEKHILPRHGSKTRALKFQELDLKTRSFFTIGPTQVNEFSKRTVEAFVDNWERSGIKWYWTKTVDEDGRISYKLVLESPPLGRDIGRDAAPGCEHIVCSRLRVVFGLGEAGLWIASCYPILK